VLTRTLRLGLVCTAICVFFGYPLAYFLARAERRVAMIGLFLLVTPLMVSAVIRTFGWLVILGRRGLVNSVFDAVGLDRVPLLYDQLLISYQWSSASAIATLLVIATTSLAFIALAVTRRSGRQEQGT